MPAGAESTTMVSGAVARSAKCVPGGRALVGVGEDFGAKRMVVASATSGVVRAVCGADFRSVGAGISGSRARERG